MTAQKSLEVQRGLGKVKQGISLVGIATGTGNDCEERRRA
jgi:hypothetical protein